MKTIMTVLIMGLGVLSLAACATAGEAPAKKPCKAGGSGYWNLSPQADIGNPGNPGDTCF